VPDPLSTDILSPELLRRMRKTAGLTQKELAQLSGVSQALISRIEAGSVDPRLSTIRKIISAIRARKSGRSALPVSRIMHRSVIAIKASDPVYKAIDLMEKHDISQLPVTAGEGRIVGSIQEITVVKALTQSKLSADKILKGKIHNIMEETFPMVSPETSIDEVATLLMHGTPAVLVMKRNKAIGIVTKIDLIKAFKGEA
jgi:predicted transcriptional regulator